MHPPGLAIPDQIAIEHGEPHLAHPLQIRHDDGFPGDPKPPQLTDPGIAQQPGMWILIPELQQLEPVQLQCQAGQLALM